ncbi:MAG: hypothetical protein ACJ8F7_19835 [Gemmataceae bacterium]
MSPRNLCVVALLLGLAGQARADDRYYMLLFTSQGEPKLPRNSHTFAAFVRTSPDHSRVEGYCISWMPRSLAIEPTRLHPVDGKNLTLAETFQWIRSIGARVTLRGPYPIRKELYDLAGRQADRLNRGDLRYILLDRRYRGSDASNCIHAVCDLDVNRPPLTTGANFGDDSGEPLVEHFRRHFVPAAEPTRWLTDRLNITPKEVRFAALTP